MRIEPLASAAHIEVRWRPFNLREILDHLGRILALLSKTPTPIIARAKSVDGERLLKESTDEARGLGIFGAPTFAIGQEIFWGDDRLADALSFASVAV
jgi:2-hydroxychromene-2-carboxylate isomerase